MMAGNDRAPRAAQQGNAADACAASLRSAAHARLIACTFGGAPRAKTGEEPASVSLLAADGETIKVTDSSSTTRSRRSTSAPSPTTPRAPPHGLFARRADRDRPRRVEAPDGEEAGDFAVGRERAA